MYRSTCYNHQILKERIENMKAIVIGATGATGRELVKQLLAKEWVSEVVALVARKKLPDHGKLNQQIIDFDKIEEYADLIKGDIAFTCMGTTLKIAGSKEAQWKVDYDYQYQFAQIAKRNGVPTFVLLSAMNADSRSSVFYSKMKGKLEESIVSLDFSRLMIFHPSLLIRPNTDRPLEKLSANILNGLNKIGLLKKYKPLRVSDVATAMIESTHHFNHKINRIEVEDILTLIK
mgnify:CR=1 FL=1